MAKPISPEQSVTAQQRWIEEHGGSLTGYIARYGSRDDPGHYGNGGEAIFEADMAELTRRERHSGMRRRRTQFVAAVALGTNVMLPAGTG